MRQKFQCEHLDTLLQNAVVQILLEISNINRDFNRTIISKVTCFLK